MLFPDFTITDICHVQIRHLLFFFENKTQANQQLIYSKAIMAESTEYRLEDVKATQIPAADIDKTFRSNSIGM